jgi:hypothetical protein
MPASATVERFKRSPRRHPRGNAVFEKVDPAAARLDLASWELRRHGRFSTIVSIPFRARLTPAGVVITRVAAGTTGFLDAVVSSSVPERATLALLGLGIAGIGFARRSRLT